MTYRSELIIFFKIQGHTFISLFCSPKKCSFYTYGFLERNFMIKKCVKIFNFLKKMMKETRIFWAIFSDIWINQLCRYTFSVVDNLKEQIFDFFRGFE